MKISLKSKVLFLIIFFACFSGQVSYADEPALEIHPVINARELVVVEEPFKIEEFERVLLYIAVTDIFELYIPYEDPMKTDGIFGQGERINIAVENNLIDAWNNVQAKYPEYFELLRNLNYETYKISSKKAVLKIMFNSDHFDNDEITEMKHKLLKKTEDTMSDLIAAKSLTKEMNDKEKAKVLYEWIAVNNTYDTDYKDNVISFNGFGLITYNTGVCSAYTSVYNLMLKMAGIKEVEGIIGTAGLGGNMGTHIWTRANLDGEILHIDSTWGDPVPDIEGYCDFSYFAVDEGYLSRHHHYWDKEKYKR